MAVRLGGRDRARGLVRGARACCGRRRGSQEPGWRPLPGGVGRALGSARRRGACARDRRRAARGRRARRLRRARLGARQPRAHVHLDRLLGRAGVRQRAVRRPLPRVQPVAGDPAAAAAGPTRSAGAAGRPRSRCSSSPGSSSCRAGASCPATLATAAVVYTRLHARRCRPSSAIETWTRHGEAFAVYFDLFSRISVWRRATAWSGLRPPLGGLPRSTPVPGTVLFVVRDDRHRHVRRPQPGPDLDGPRRSTSRSAIDGLVGLDAAPKVVATVGLLARRRRSIGALLPARDRRRALGRRRHRRRRSCGARSSTRWSRSRWSTSSPHYLTFLLFEGQATSTSPRTRSARAGTCSAPRRRRSTTRT